MNSHKSTRKQFLLRFGYCGHRFYGVQPQGGKFPTVGDAIRSHLEVAAGEPARALQFAARTDRGVHALSSIATCWFPNTFDVDGFLHKLQQQSYDDGLFFLTAALVPYTTHARTINTGKRYRYIIEANCSDLSPCNPYAWQISPKLNIKAMQEAASFLEGTHDFQSLRGSDCSAASSIKTLYSVRVHGPIFLSGKREQVHIDVYGDAFLRKMMRNLTGLLVEIGCGLRRADSIPAILAEQKRQSAGIMAPAQGLTLQEVCL